MYFDYEKQVESSRFYNVGKTVAAFLTPFVYDFRCYGKENIPLSGPLIIACNHIGSTDPALIIANCPRKIFFMAKSELFENGMSALLVNQMNAFPVKRNALDRKALKYAVKVLENGFVLGIFPEGRTVKELVPTEAKSGVAYLADKTGADVLPVCIYRNPDEKKKRHKLVLRFGRVIKNNSLFERSDNRSTDIRKAADIIMNEIIRMWEEEHCR